MWIFHLYFSELYFILYELYKFAVILVLFYFRVHNFGALGIPSLGTQHHCQAGPTAMFAGHTGTRPTGQFNGRELARSRCRAFVTAMAGVARRDRAREGSRSTRKHKTSHTRVMPLCFGHRRQLTEQWRTAALASEAVDLGDETEHGEEREEVEQMRVLTLKSRARSAWSGKARQIGRAHV